MIRVLLSVLIFSLFSCQSDNKKILLDPGNIEWTKQAPSFFQVRCVTSQGNFVIDIERELAPVGVDRFYNLVRLGYFNNARFHRVVKNFIVQFGIAGNPKVSQVWKNEYIPDDPVVGSNTLALLCHVIKEGKDV